jgi:hypothetical protein
MYGFIELSYKSKCSKEDTLSKERACWGDLLAGKTSNETLQNETLQPDRPNSSKAPNGFSSYPQVTSITEHSAINA